jgi:malonate transporter
MSAILNSVLPLFAVIFLGYFAGRSRILGETAVKGLTTFVFCFALPPLLFRLMARSEVGKVTEWSFLLAYLCSEVPMFLFGALVAGAALRRAHHIGASAARSRAACCLPCRCCSGCKGIRAGYRRS